MARETIELVGLSEIAKNGVGHEAAGSQLDPALQGHAQAPRPAGLWSDLAEGRDPRLARRLGLYPPASEIEVHSRATPCTLCHPLKRTGGQLHLEGL